MASASIRPNQDVASVCCSLADMTANEDRTLGRRTVLSGRDVTMQNNIVTSTMSIVWGSKLTYDLAGRDFIGQLQKHDLGGDPVMFIRLDTRFLRNK